MVASLPLMLAVALITAPNTFAGIDARPWLGLAYVSIFSMLVGFVFWYRGLTEGGTAAVGQAQLLQPFFGLARASALRAETVSVGMIGVTVAVIACVAAARSFAAG
jgi:drug/metabolite transporter (DMT)-like permease